MKKIIFFSILQTKFLTYLTKTVTAPKRIELEISAWWRLKVLFKSFQKLLAVSTFEKGEVP